MRNNDCWGRPVAQPAPQDDLDARDARLREYVGANGYWFASGPGQEQDARRASVCGIIRRADNLEDLTPEERARAQGFWVPVSCRSKNAMAHGLYRRVVLGEPC